MIFFQILTVYSMFANDIRLIFNSKEQDIYFQIIIIVIYFLFMIDIIIQCFVKKGYVGGFYFWFDIISTFTLLIDI